MAQDLQSWEDDGSLNPGNQPSAMSMQDLQSLIAQAKGTGLDASNAKKRLVELAQSQTIVPEMRATAARAVASMAPGSGNMGGGAAGSQPRPPSSPTLDAASARSAGAADKMDRIESASGAANQKVAREQAARDATMKGGADAGAGGVPQSPVTNGNTESGANDWFNKVSGDRLDVLYSNPDTARKMYSQSTGADPRSFHQGYIENDWAAAQAFSEMGMLGGGGGVGDLMGGPSDPQGNLRNMGGFLDSISGRGADAQYVNSDSFFEGALGRAGNTNFSDAGANSMSAEPGQQIEMTNAALMSSGTYMTPSAAKAMQSRLNSAADQWFQMQLSGETNETYPQFLQALGASEWF